MSKINKVKVGNTTYDIEDTSKQEILVSGTNIKTINNQSILGSGNITIEGGEVEPEIYIETKVLTSNDIINGYWTASTMAWTSSTTRLTTNRILQFKAGDKLSFKTNTLQIGIWTWLQSDTTAANVINNFAYGLTDTVQTITFVEDSYAVIQFKKSNNATVTVNEYDAEVTLEVQVEATSQSDTIEIEELKSDDFIRATTTLPQNSTSSSTTRLCTSFIRSARKGDIITYNSQTLQVGIWVVYAGDTTPTNIVEYTTTPNTQKFTLPKDAIEILFQIKKSNNTAITVSEYNAEISIIRSKIIADSVKSRLPRYECIKSVNHRGYQELAPENTLPAFKASAEHNFEWIETDVQFTSDNIPVILHDQSINRTARNIDGSTISGTVNINTITYAEALNYDFGIWFSSEFAGTKIPTFEQMINYCKNLGLKVRIELKDETVTTTNLPTLIDIVNKYGMIKNVEWASFNLTLLQYIATNYPTFDIGYIVSTISATTVSNAQGLKTSTNNVTVAGSVNNSDANIKLLSDAGIPLDLWTVTNPKQIFDANKYVSSITTNRYNAADILYGLF